MFGLVHQTSAPMICIWVVFANSACYAMSFTSAWVGKLQLKWLSFMGAVLIEFSASEILTSMADSIARELWPLLLEGLDHPFKACREEIARCFYDRVTFWVSSPCMRLILQAFRVYRFESVCTKQE